MGEKQALVPRLRFPEFRDVGEWEKKELAEIARFYKGKGISKADIKPNGSQSCIRYGELYTAWPQKLSATPEHFAKVLSHVLPRTQH